jgi:signal transduction histidine kinase
MTWTSRKPAGSKFAAGAAWLGLAAWAGPMYNSQAALEVTNVHQIRLLAAPPTNSYFIRLDGDVWWANARQGRLVLKDDSGAEELELDWGGTPVEAGQRVHLEGNATIAPIGAGFKLGVRGPVVENDGVHSMVEKSGSVFLTAGRNPIRVEWFNGAEKYGLSVEYQGPDLPRQKIPDSALYRVDVNKATGSSNWVHGLDFVCSDAPGEMLPDFNPATALKIGVVANFQLEVIPRNEHIGLCFSGFLETAKDGLYTFCTTSDDGSRLFVGVSSLQLKVLGRAAFPQPHTLVREPLETGEHGQWVQVDGKVTFASETPEGLNLELSTGVGRMRAVVADSRGLLPANLLNRRVRATGFFQNAYSADDDNALGALLVPSQRELALLAPAVAVEETATAHTNQLPRLTTAAEIHRLKREEAGRGYPVKLRGVVTSLLPEHQAFTIQDSTRGIYVIDHSESLSAPPRIGDFLEIEGMTEPGQFAPVAIARRIGNLGIGELPEAVHPTRDQLMNGSLDAQYVEVRGIISLVQSNRVTLLTPDGRIRIELRVTGLKPEDTRQFGGALVRVRGCLFATWDYVTRQVKAGEIRILGAEVAVDQPPPADLFSTPRKTVAELFLFDPQASVFQRVKVRGQIIHAQEPIYFMMDGKDGIRFEAKQTTGLKAGDLVEVVGFPELSSGSPVLREAVARKTGHAAMPEARLLAPEDLTRADLDSTRVRVKAVLVNQRTTLSGEALEMRVGLRSFLALLPPAGAGALSIPEGSQLELTGTYASQGVSQEATSFGLLLDSPADIKVLARPPWWTLEKLLFILGALGCVLAVTLLWITQLRRKVGQRTAELETQIRERQHVEQQRVMEQERARIAQDLHDELGSGLTEISMLGARARSDSTAAEARVNHVDQMGHKAREMVMALDEIVWAMNPTHDSLASMISYFSLYAERFLGLAGVAWRLESPFVADDCQVDSRRRHQLFLAFKEALNNVVRHSRATEVRVNFQVKPGWICLRVADNGRGWAEGDRTQEMDGVANMRRRLEKMGGRFELQSKPGEGMAVGFDLPLN